MIERARTEFENLLPEGLNTSNQYLLSVINNNVNIAYLWLHIFAFKEQKKCFIYDIKNKYTYRGHGLGTKKMECVEEYCKNKDVEIIGLHVFGHNKRAVSFYNKMVSKLQIIAWRRNWSVYITGGRYFLWFNL